jgi:hypothetical protein
MLGQSETEDFLNALQKHGRSPEEFEVSVKDARQGLAYGRCSIIVRKGGTVREYDPAQWVSEFERDLNAQIF